MRRTCVRDAERLREVTEEGAMYAKPNHDLRVLLLPPTQPSITVRGTDILTT